MPDSFPGQHPQQDLFEVKINATGKLYIQKFASIAKISVLLGVLVTLVSVAMTIIRLVKLGRPFSDSNGLIGMVNSFYPYYTLVHAVLACLLLYYYGVAGRCLKTGIDYSDDESFNQAFPALYRSTMFAVINFALTFLVDVPYFVWIAKHYL